jgi:hypothetical protein
MRRKWWKTSDSNNWVWKVVKMKQEYVKQFSKIRLVYMLKKGRSLVIYLFFIAMQISFLSRTVLKFCFLSIFSYLWWMMFLPVFAASSSLVASEIVANAEEIPETKASRNGEQITLGTCVVTFRTINWLIWDELNCNDNEAVIVRFTLSWPRSATTIAGRLRALSNVHDTDHGALKTSWGGPNAFFTTSGTEISATELWFADATSWDISTIVSIPWVVAQAAVAQVVTFTPTLEGYGETFTITINTSGSSYTSQQGDDLEDVLSGLQAQLLWQSEVLCSHDGAKITCTAVVPWTGFSYLASVTDITAPEVILSWGDMIIEIGSNFVDPWAIWMDNVDGSWFILASDGMVDTGTLSWYVLEYWYTDLAGNTSIAVKRVVTVDDLTAPEVSLSGDAVMHIYQWSVYTEPGATWIDNVDGSGMITIASSWMVDIWWVGTYLLEYRYTDAAGNTGNIVTRTVIVDPLPIAWVCGSSYGVCNAWTVVSWADNSCGADDSWTCNGLHGWENVSCSAPNPVCVTYSWQIGNWWTCSVACWWGIQSRTVVCKGSDEEIVADSFCMGEEKPPVSQSCNTETCPVHGQCGSSYGVCNAWTVVSWVDNSCGADDSWACDGLHGWENVSCSAPNPVCVTYSWQIGNWWTCSVACWWGIQSRTVVCKGSDEEIVADSFCVGEEKPTLSQSCNTATCPVHGQCGSSYGVCNAWTVVSWVDNSCGADDSWTCNGLHGWETITCFASNTVCPATGSSTVPSSSGWWSHQWWGSLPHGTWNTAAKTSPNVSWSWWANERIYITPRNVYIQLWRFLKNPTISAQTNAPDGTVLWVYWWLLNKKRKKVWTVVVKDWMVLFEVPRPGRYGLSIE